jgi:hypothetical protein
MYNSSVEFRDDNILVQPAIWINSIEAINKINVSKKKEEHILKIYCDVKADKKILEIHKYNVKNKELREFKFLSNDDKCSFIFNIRRIYFNLKKGYIKIIEN